MTHFQAFDSFEDMQAAMKSAEEAAEARMTDEQRAIERGTFVYSIADMSGPVVVIGYLFTYEEMVELETKHLQEGETRADAIRTANEYSSRFLNRHYAYGRWYSILCPEGEYGDKHLSQVRPIDPVRYAVLLQDIYEGRNPIDRFTRIDQE